VSVASSSANTSIRVVQRLNLQFVFLGLVPALSVIFGGQPAKSACKRVLWPVYALFGAREQLAMSEKCHMCSVRRQWQRQTLMKHRSNT
jgi:hypothetical protein